MTEMINLTEAEPGPHGLDPTNCPTFYDCCHCTVETLVHNIERAEAAEAELAHLRALLARRDELPTVCPACIDMGVAVVPRVVWDGTTLCCPSCGFDALGKDDGDE